MNKLDEVYARLEAIKENAESLLNTAIDCEQDNMISHWHSYLDAIEDAMDVVKMVSND